MITLQEAKSFAKKKINDLSKQFFNDTERDYFVLLEDETVQFEQGWMFFWTSKKYFDTKNIDFAPLGNGPFFITKYGKVIELPTSNHPSVYIEELKKNGTLMGEKV